MGSLIKNGGGTIVSGGAYVAGRADLVERALARLTAPGIGTDAGCVPGETLRLMFQGDVGLQQPAGRQHWLWPDNLHVACRMQRWHARLMQQRVCDCWNCFPGLNQLG